MLSWRITPSLWLGSCSPTSQSTLSVTTTGSRRLIRRAAVMTPPLAAIFSERTQPEEHRFLAATVLAKYASKEPEILTELLLDSNTRQFPVILEPLGLYLATISERYRNFIKAAPGAGASREQTIDFASRQANAVIALFLWGDAETLWPLLRDSLDPQRRAYLIDRLSVLTSDPTAILQCLDDKTNDVFVRQALILILGGLASKERAGSWADQAAARVLELYRDDVDPGIHSAAEWALQRCQQIEQLKEARRPACHRPGTRRAQWYVTQTGQLTMVLVKRGRFRMGSDELDEDRDSDEVGANR